MAARTAVGNCDKLIVRPRPYTDSADRTIAANMPRALAK